MNTKNMRTAVTVSLMLFIAIPLAACGNTATGSDADHAKLVSGAKCVLPKPTVTADTPTVAILGESGPALSDYQQDIDMVVSTAVSQKAHIIVNGVSAGTDAPDLVTNIVLT